MSANLLKIKISIPPQAPNVLQRPKLLEELGKSWPTRAGYGRQLTLISAPAGFGKTTLARSLMAGREDRSAWYALDQGDNERERFWLYLLSALRSVEKDLGQGAMEILRSSGLGSDLPPESDLFLAPLLNDLFSLEQPLGLVIDDYHQISNSLIHRDMIFFIENLPPHAHLVVTTRSEPPWPLARWRARGEMAEARQKDLRFSKDETLRLFETRKELKLSDPQIQALHQKTEGWITGLQLAAISLAESSAPNQFIANFAGSHRHVFHFLIEEVFTRQPEALRDFLLQTSVLNRFQASLCRAVTGREDSAELMAELERKNLFLTALDDEGEWYRYHPLFADLLRHQLKRTMPEKVEQLHEKAARWFMEAVEPGEAIRHALEGNKLQLAVRVLDENIEALMQEEGTGLLNECLALIPYGLLAQYPHLAVYKAWFYLVQKGREEAGRIIDQAGQIEAAADFSDDGDRKKLSGILAVVKAYYHIYKQNFTRALEEAEKALDLLPSKSSYWRTRVGIILGDARLFSGNPKDAYRYYLEAHRDNEAYGNAYLILNTGFKAATALHHRGRLKEAESMTRDLIQGAKNSGLARLPRCGLLWTLLGDCLREKGSLEEAERCIERGLFLSEPEKPSQGWNYLYRIALDYSLQDYHSALDRLDELEQLHQEVALPNFILIPATAWRALLLLALGKSGEAREILDRGGVEENGQIPGGRERCYLTLAEVLIEEGFGAYLEAERILRQIKSAAESGEHSQLLLETLLTTARLEESRGNSKAAEEVLFEALRSGVEKGYYQSLLDRGRELGPVYIRIISGKKAGRPGELESKASSLAGRILSGLAGLEGVMVPGKPQGEDVKLQGEPPEEKPRSPASGDQGSFGDLIEELSPREMEVLALFSQGLSNQEVADKLFLSPGTVKWHSGNIYGKLGVRGRLQAVALARNLKLIS